ncbi:IS5 family transposase [Chitinimonas sp. BJB300]|uniref:IS5 family transposase n=3 Tax=Chitinimonas sp. BJB300 TaxID=1559339 RepID=UPI001111CBFA|nr:IS5 family transposase [Chitinimonas sp. BJB300]TSJ89025.1 IS5 family transposase [Chitinimonas sp. BJB300]
MIKSSLFASEEREAKLDQLGDALKVLGTHVDFTALAADIDRAAPRPSRARGGRPPFPTELMVRVLLVQQLFNLSDEQMEFQLLDRLSFQRFVGLRSSSQIPDRTTIWTFKERLIAAGASDSIFEAANRELAKHGYIARGGQMVDASIVHVPKQSVNREEKAMIQERAMPADWSPAKRRQKDLDARWTKKHGKSYFGYKVSTSVDKRYKLIRKRVVSTASEHDTLHFERVLDQGNTSRDVWTDRGYVDGEREARLIGQGWRMHNQRKGRADKPLSECQKRRNRRIAKIRARVEHPFASLAQLGGKALRCIGLARATLNLHWKIAGYNLQRLCYLKVAGVVAF